MDRAWDEGGPGPRRRRPAPAPPTERRGALARTAIDLQGQAGNRAASRVLAVAAARLQRTSADVLAPPLLRRGSRGTAVRQLQQRLATVLGRTQSAADGIFGPLTERDVRAFQAANGLSTDGIVGPVTRSALGITSTPPDDGVISGEQPEGPNHQSTGGETAGPETETQPAGPTIEPGPQPTNVDPDLAVFSQSAFEHEGTRFRSTYTPVGPEPETGELTITLRIHITYQDFTEEIQNQPPYDDLELTPEQLADVAWTDEEKDQFETLLRSSIADGWGGKHALTLREPGFANYRSAVTVNVAIVEDPGSAHNRMRAIKVPEGLPRFRSFVQGDTSILEIRDPEGGESFEVQPVDRLRQISPFGHDSADLTAGLDEQVVDASRMIRERAGQPADASGSLPPGTGEVVLVNGRTTISGDEQHNLELAQQRAEAVDTRLRELLPGLNTQVTARGEADATNEARFRRVDIALDFDTSREDTDFNTAAHEAGHMFGLDDEYVDAELHRLAGDLPDHYEDVDDLIGPEAADEVRVQNAHSMMSMGNQVKRGHYVYFLEALNQMTAKQWSVE